VGYLSRVQAGYAPALTEPCLRPDWKRACANMEG
jgi:hypothetical protein